MNRYQEIETIHQLHNLPFRIVCPLCECADCSSFVQLSLNIPSVCIGELSCAHCTKTTCPLALDLSLKELVCCMGLNRTECCSKRMICSNVLTQIFHFLMCSQGCHSLQCLCISHFKEVAPCLYRTIYAARVIIFSLSLTNLCRFLSMN